MRSLVASLCLLLISSSPLAAQDEGGTLLPAPQPFRSDLDDPMLRPAPRAARTIDRWDEAVGLLRASSPEDRRAEAAIERAEGRWRQALGALLPNARVTGQVAYDLLNPDVPALGAGAGAAAAAGGMSGRGGAPPSVPVGTLSATATQTLVDLAAWEGLRAGSAATRSARSNRVDVRRRLTFGLARGLVAVVAAERIAELNRLGLRQALEREALTARTRQLGAATELDLVRVRQDVEVARGALIAGDEQLRRTREALGAALGQGELGVMPDFALDPLVAELRRACAPLPAPGARPDLVAAREQVEAARASRRQAARGYLPTVGLATNLFGYTTDPGFGRFATWSIAGVVSVPIWEGGTRAGLVRERAGALREAEANQLGLARDVELEIAQARRGTQVAQDLLGAARAARALAERTDQMTRRSFEVGRSGSLELVQSAAALRQADVLLATREFELVSARLAAILTEATCNW